MTRTRRQKSLKVLKKTGSRNVISARLGFLIELFVIRCQRVKKEIGERSLVRAYLCPACHAWHVTSHK